MSRIETDPELMLELEAAMMDEARKNLVRYAPTSLSLTEWAQRHRTFQGKPFSFDGHEYLREPYREFMVGHRYCVLEKAAQMGASELAMTAALWFCDRYEQRRAIFFLPSDELVSDFSNDRVSPIINGSPYLSAICQGINNVGLKQVGFSSLYMRGMYAKSKVKSVPADFLIFDELDEVKRSNKQQAIERISHSPFRWVMELSTPTLPEFGVDERWQDTDQRYWHLACRCPEGVILEDHFPDCVGERGGRFFLRCPVCGKEDLNPCEPAVAGEYVGWIPKKPEIATGEMRGYHLTQLFSTVEPLADIMELWESGRDRDEFHNSKLGQPFAGDRMPLQMPTLRRCDVGLYPMLAQRETDHERIYMGVDQGLECHIVVTRRIGQRRQVLWLEKTDKKLCPDPFKRVAQLIALLKPTCTVIDGNPNAVPARDIAAHFKEKRIPVYVCHYTEAAKNEVKWDKKLRMVTAHRTNSLDNMVDDWVAKVYAVNGLHPITQEAFRHLSGIAKKQEVDEKTGIEKVIYIKTRDDHFAHAFNYEQMAANYPWGNSHFDML